MNIKNLCQTYIFQIKNPLPGKITIDQFIINITKKTYRCSVFKVADFEMPLLSYFSFFVLTTSHITTYMSKI